MQPQLIKAIKYGLDDFVYAGGGLMGVHGTTVAFTRWPGGVEDWPEMDKDAVARRLIHEVAKALAAAGRG